MNWKIWGCVALMGLMNMAQGIAFKDAPTVKEVIIDSLAYQPDFGITRTLSTNYKNSYTWSANNMMGAVIYIIEPYSNTNEPYYKIPVIPSNLSDEEGQKYFREHIIPPKNLGKYAHSIVISIINKESRQNVPISAFQRLSNTFLKRCYGFNPTTLQKANKWISQNYGNEAEINIGAINLKILTSPDNISMLAINGFPPQNIGVLYPNQQGWTQFCRE